MIQIASQEDVKEVHALICSLEEEDFLFVQFEKIYLKNIKNNDIYYYVYKENKKCLGFISLYKKNTLHHNGITAEIVELVVDEHYRDQKIGSQLLSYILEKAKELDVLEVELSSSMRRTKAHAFYQNHGFIKDHYNLVKRIL